MVVVCCVCIDELDTGQRTAAGDTDQECLKCSVSSVN